MALNAFNLHNVNVAFVNKAPLMSGSGTGANYGPGDHMRPVGLFNPGPATFKTLLINLC